jgi:small basic protein
VIFLPLVALFIGIFVGAFFNGVIDPKYSEYSVYFGITCLAGLDTVCGGIRSGLEGKFRNDVFLTGFVSNALIAYFLAWLGDRIGINLYVAVAFVLGWRLFTNLSLIRRAALTRWQDSQERKRLQTQAQSAISAQPETNL